MQTAQPARSSPDKCNGVARLQGSQRLRPERVLPDWSLILHAKALIPHAYVESGTERTVRIKLIFLPLILKAPQQEPGTCHHPFQFDQRLDIITIIADYISGKSAVTRTVEGGGKRQALVDISVVFKPQLVRHVECSPSRRGDQATAIEPKLAQCGFVCDSDGSSPGVGLAIHGCRHCHFHVGPLIYDRNCG